LKEKIKLVLSVLIILAVFFVYPRLGIRGEKIALVAELPDTPEYTIDGVFVDIGIVYDMADMDALGSFSFNKKWCLFNGDDCWVTDKEKLDEMAQKAGIQLQSNMKLPFWDEWGDRIAGVFAFIVVLLGMHLWKIFVPRKMIILPPIGKAPDKENAATLIFQSCYHMEKYNGRDALLWAVMVSTDGAGVASVLLPPGECFITLGYRVGDWKAVYSIAHHTVHASLEAGKTYVIKSVRYRHNRQSALSTKIEECKGKDLKTYLSRNYSPVTVKEIEAVEGAGENVSKDNPKQYFENFVKKMQNEGHHLDVMENV
jgi:hypothetical protein